MYANAEGNWGQARIRLIILILPVLFIAAYTP